jgi:hypothetical protein
MDAPYQSSPDVHVLPTNLALPGVGVLPINAFVLMSEEPVLVDAGIGFDRDDFVAALESIVDPAALRWVWLTHDDADHTGALERVLELAPNAQLVTHAMGALRMASWWNVPLDRVRAIRIGDELHVGDRTLRAVAPPLFDNPTSTGFVDMSTGALFSVDAFGAILPEPAESVDDIPPEALAGGMLGWATADSPWAHLVDRDRFGGVLESVRQLQPTSIHSSHLPAAGASSVGHFLQVLATVPDAAPFVPPNHEEFAFVVAALTAAQQAQAPAPA